MTDIRSKISELYSLEQLAGGDSPIHRLHPLAKLAATLVYTGCVVSFGRLRFAPLAPYVFYPVLVMALADVPWGMVARRTLLALPFCLFVGISDLALDRSVLFFLGGTAVTGGMLACAALLLRTFLCVAAVLVLVAVTPLAQLTGELRRLHVPGMLVLLFEMTYRYIGTLLGEAFSLHTAYLVRRGPRRGISLRDAGCLIGQLLLRSFDRAERIYAAMQCRGYSAAMPAGPRRAFSGRDAAFLAAVCVPSLLLRLGAPAFWLQRLAEVI